jgi:hypothetical protein
MLIPVIFEPKSNFLISSPVGWFSLSAEPIGPDRLDGKRQSQYTFPAKGRILLMRTAVTAVRGARWYSRAGCN